VIQLKRTFEAAAGSGALQQLAARLQEGCRTLTLSGAAGGAKALAVARAVLSENRPAAVFTPSNQEAQNLAQELQFYVDLLSPAPVEIIPLPGLEVDPYRGLSPHPEIAAARARTLWQLLQDGPKVLVASVKAASVRLHSPQRFLNYCLMLKQDEEMSPDMMRDYLFESGYVEDDPVTDPGEFSLRGGILDVFPPHMEKPFRLEFFGDRIESIRLFDADSQRSVGTTLRVEIIPMREYCFRRDLLREWAEKAPSLWSAPFLPHLQEELALARQNELFPAFEFLLPAADPFERTIFDYLKGYRLIILEREVLENTLARHHAELYERFVDRIEALKPVLPPEQIYVTADEFRSSIDRFPRLEVEELGMTGPEPSPIYLSSQSTRRYHGNIRELISDVKKFRDEGETIAIILSNLGRAERINDILSEYGIPARLCRSGGQEHPAGLHDSETVLLGVGALHSGYYLPAINLRGDRPGSL
jgi:transcription-repair coupling factor (superfamily II helicase)